MWGKFFSVVDLFVINMLFFILGYCFENISFVEAFERLHLRFKLILQTSHSCDVIKGWGIEYSEQRHDENFNWNVSSMDELFSMLDEFSYYCPFNPGLLKHFAHKSKNVYLIKTVENYEERFSQVELSDLPFVNKVKLFGDDISAKESDLIANTLLENRITVGELWNLCSPRIVYGARISFAASELILNASEPLLKFYRSIKVCT